MKYYYRYYWNNTIGIIKNTVLIRLKNYALIYSTWNFCDMTMNDNKAIPDNLVVARWHYKFTWNLRGYGCKIVNFWIFVLMFLHDHYGVGNNVSKFQVSTMKIELVARIWNAPVMSIMMTHRFHKQNNKLRNLWEIGLFHVIWGDLRFLKVTIIIIIRFGENKDNIYQFRGWAGGLMVHLTLLIKSSSSRSALALVLPALQHSHFAPEVTYIPINNLWCQMAIYIYIYIYIYIHTYIYIHIFAIWHHRLVS